MQQPGWYLRRLRRMSGAEVAYRVARRVRSVSEHFVSMDVPPFCTVAGDRARLHGLNVIGLRRRGFAPDTIAALKRAYRLAFQGGGRRRDGVERARESCGHVPAVTRLLDFVAASPRGVCR